MDDLINPRDLPSFFLCHRTDQISINTIGLGTGAVLSLDAATLARSMLFGLSAYDLRTLISAAVLLMLVALIAT